MERIVVGVDGSPGSTAALRWAVGEATLRGATIEAVQAFHIPYASGSTIAPLALDPAEFRASAEATLAKAVAEVDPGASVTVTQHAVEGPASLVLVEASAGAALLVVGARGHGGLTGMLLGSVSRQVSEHATVPVVVVPREGSES